MLIVFIFPPAIVWYEENIIAKKVDQDGNIMTDEQGNELYKCPGCICWQRIGCFKKKGEEIGPDG